jgi:hypothetical protein
MQTGRQAHFQFMTVNSKISFPFPSLYNPPQTAIDSLLSESCCCWPLIRDVCSLFKHIRYRVCYCPNGVCFVPQVLTQLYHRLYAYLDTDTVLIDDTLS